MVNFEDFKTMVIKGVEANFINDKELTPVLFMATADDNIGMMPIPSNSPESKSVLIELIIPAAIEHSNANMIATVNEAWMRTQSPTKPVDTSVPVSEHPDKIEIVMVTIETKVTTEMVIWKIKRPEGADPYLELDEKLGNNTNVAGRFANLLGQKPSKN